MEYSPDSIIYILLILHSFISFSLLTMQLYFTNM